MDVVEAIRTRRSIREFTGERIPDEHLELILDAARYAPSPENMQMVRYLVIRDDQEMKDLIANASAECAATVFSTFPYEATQGRLWYIPDPRRAATYEVMKDGELFLYPAKSDAVIIVLASESWHDSSIRYPTELFGSVVAAMGVFSMWLVTTSLGYGAAYQAFPFSDPRHAELICDRLGVPRSWLPLCAFCIGKPIRARMLGPSRFQFESMMYSERWGNPFKRMAFREEE